MIDQAFAEHFAADWIYPWNEHDLARIVPYYTDNFEMTSSAIVWLLNEPSGSPIRKDAVRPYWPRRWN